MSSLIAEAKRCLQCKVPMCSKNCPIHTPIPAVTKLFLEGDLKQAGEILFRNNPFSAITAIVCPHERNCAGHCVLGIKGSPCEFYQVEQYISRLYLETYEPPVIEKNGIRAAVVGAGPAGITMSLVLALNGFDVTLFDSMSDIGGVLRYGIPDFRLPKDFLSLYKDILIRTGVKFRPNTSVGVHLSMDDLFMDGYKAIYLSTGTGRPNKLGLLGESLGHVHFAVDFLRTPSAYTLGRRVVVVGSGNVAMDVARTVIRKNHSQVSILNFMGPDKVTADKQEEEMALMDGAVFYHNTQIVRIMDDCVRCVEVAEKVQEDGSIYYEEDFTKTFDLPADSVILAIGQGPGSDLRYGNMKFTARGLFEVNEDGETATPGVFAGGDSVTGPRTVVQAVASTMTASRKMIEYLLAEH